MAVRIDDQCGKEAKISFHCPDKENVQWGNYLQIFNENSVISDWKMKPLHIRQTVPL